MTGLIKCSIVEACEQVHALDRAGMDHSAGKVARNACKQAAP